MTRPVIYFLCTGNSCRSQMAEGFMHHIAGDRVEVHSAGVVAHGLNPRAVDVMREAGVDIAGHTSKVIDPAILARADYVITLCGDARDACPVTPPEVRRLHWDFIDPARATGSEEDILRQFRAVRDGIRGRIEEFLGSLIGNPGAGGDSNGT